MYSLLQSAYPIGDTERWPRRDKTAGLLGDSHTFSCARIGVAAPLRAYFLRPSGACARSLVYPVRLAGRSGKILQHHEPSPWFWPRSAVNNCHRGQRNLRA